jgi:DNA-binding response OmpR family regulator
MLPYEILVVEDDERALEGMLELLRDAGHNVTGAATFDAAKGLLELRRYDLLITDIRLRAFNGLQLVRRSRLLNPNMAVILVTAFEDAMLELEAARYRAEYLLKPVKPADLVNAVKRALARVRRERRWPRKAVGGTLVVQVGDWPARIVDASYGGLRLEMTAPSAPLPTSFFVRLPALGLALPVEAIWSDRLQTPGALVCGLALLAEGEEAPPVWRRLVDSLPEGGGGAGLPA